LISLQQSQTIFVGGRDSAGVGVNKRSSRFYLPSIKHWRARDDALNCASQLELFTLSLGPDDYSERLLAVAYWIPFFAIRTYILESISHTKIYITYTTIFSYVIFFREQGPRSGLRTFFRHYPSLSSSPSSFSYSSRSPRVYPLSKVATNRRRLPPETAYSVIHTHTLSPVRSRTWGYPRHPSWKKTPPGTGAEFVLFSTLIYRVLS